MPATKDAITAFLANYPAGVRESATSLRAFIRSTIPDASETLDESGRVIGYAVGAGYAGLVCTIILSKAGVKLGIVRGAELSDPHHLLEGSGKRHRYVQISAPSDLARAGIGDLLKAARALANSRDGSKRR